MTTATPTTTTPTTELEPKCCFCGSTNPNLLIKPNDIKRFNRVLAKKTRKIHACVSCLEHLDFVIHNNSR